MSIILIAPPAAGKGTQANLLKNKYDFIHISTGDLIRNVISTGTDYGKQINELVNSGKLVSDDIVIDLLKNKLQEIGSSKDYILDGFPRDINQAIYYDKLVDEMNLSHSIVIFLDLDKEVAKKRVLGRLICPNCNQIYNEYFDKPKNNGLCDKCGCKLIKRTDDTEETFDKRYDTYYNEIKPLLEYYSNSNRLFTVNGNLSEEEVFKQIEQILGDK